MAMAAALMIAILSQLVGSCVTPFHFLREMYGRTMIRTAAINNWPSLWTSVS